MDDTPSTSRMDDVNMDQDDPDVHAPSTSSSAFGQAETGKGEKDGEKPKENLFECNICLDSPNDPVVSLCGHLFCWPCLHGWLEMRPEGHQTCPVCKAAISREKAIPLFGRHSKGEDPRNKAVPPRPQAQRTEQTRHANFNHNPDFTPFGFGGGNNGFHMTVGFGAFPFTFFAQTFGLLEAAPGL
ncbi:hypothetical protein RvY_11983-2 [Ramazzottius varieornatus]|uniref:RING-type E3 ubiquitin transferase n=1 Tax=Ramazzottius varieornatus TaxID=947166 RepID=A0A1D1VM86_RAMVA|nr:hypothetical protein RvY_11983-2 [Ramazzottius varieornatus]